MNIKRLRHIPTILLFVFFINTVYSYDLLIINSQNSDPYIPVRDAMLKELKEKGLMVGGVLNIKEWSLGNREGMAKRAWISERDRNYDLIFLNGTVATNQFSQFARGNYKYKFLFGNVTDPVGLGVIENFVDKPSSNFTGVCYPVHVRERLRFLMAIFPEARDIGFIYSEMPQSISYRKWLDEVLQEKEFQHLDFHYRIVEFIQSDNGHIRMAMLSEKYIKELNNRVDLFLSPNDQLGIQPEYVKNVHRLSDKPLIGLGRKDVMNEWGAVVSIYPDLQKMGIQLANMAERLMTGTEIQEIIPQWPETGIAINLLEADRLGITIPQTYIKMAGDNIVK